MSPLYDTIAPAYAELRRPDPAIYRALRAALGDAASVVNVGAGTGSYEPTDINVVAVEPSRPMIARRAHRSVTVQARAEALPLCDDAVDAALAVLTVHHWSDIAHGLRECARVARRRVVILTWDPASAGFWLVRDYFPELLAYDRALFPGVNVLRDALGDINVVPLPIPAACTDGFLGAYWRRPEAYLDAAVRRAISSFARLADCEPGLDALRAHLASGVWGRRNGDLLDAESCDVGYRVVTVEV